MNQDVNDENVVQEEVSKRAMATVRKIDKIEPIEGADKIVCATVGGWKLVTAIDNGFKEGDLVVYCEIDSWIPTEIAAFLSKGQEPREFNGVKGERLKTIKLRGQVSQGLILPIMSVASWLDCIGCAEGTDVTEALRIQKWERPMDAQLAGVSRGNFPSFIFKSDQERIQNLARDFEKWKSEGHVFEVTEKLEGSSMTVYFNDGQFGVCSRNLDLKETEGNAFWTTARKLGLEEKMRAYGRNIAVQGELIGPNIQNNIYQLKDYEFRVFDVQRCGDVRITSDERYDVVHNLGLQNVPVVAHRMTITPSISIDEMLTIADGESELFKTAREGLVFKCVDDPRISFKVISNKYLLKHQ